MEQLHSLLRRQIRRQFGSAENVPLAWRDFIKAVDDAYRQFDEDRGMLERSLELSSQELLQANSEMRAVFTALPDIFFRLDSEGRILDYKGSESDLFLSPEAIIGKRIQDVPLASVSNSFRDAVQRVRESSSLVTIEYALEIRGQERFYEARLLPLLQGQIMAIVRNTTERRHLEEQLTQARKMEAVGQLAGGVAHDFNNLLTAITGYCDLMQRDLPHRSTLMRQSEEIRLAADRGASLTRQLLAFSRRQVLQTRLLDLNSVVADVDRLLRRLIGENIEVVTEKDSELGAIRADPGQMQQVILNLVLNARDAMPRGGRLTIRTSNRDLVERLTHPYGEIDSGSYVVLDVGDTGVGMDRETQSRIFEPFFTTKEMGKGTGLGLATVYGIVKQSGGAIVVDTEPGHGATFRLFFPRVLAQVGVEAPVQADQPAQRGSEVILLVEDEDAVRNLVRDVLLSDGYTVLEAASGRDAIDIAMRHNSHVDLLVTDVVMPHMSGRDVAVHLSAIQPRLKVLYMSGYTEDFTFLEGSGRNCRFLQKPFSPMAMIREIRALLDMD